MCTLIEALKPLNHLGYNLELSGSMHQVHLLQYADDTCLVANGPAACQELLGQFELWLHWSGMTAKVPKCFSLGIKSSTGRPFDPFLSLQNQEIPFIHNRAIKFLGYRIQIIKEVRTNLHTKLRSMLQRIDDAPVTRKQKILLYQSGLCPHILWDLTISHLSSTWVSTTLEAESNRFLKRWVSLARSANPALLYLPKAKGGLGLPSCVTLWKKQQVSRACQLISSKDPVVRYVTTQSTIKEERCSNVKFRPLVVARDVLAGDPGMGRKKLSRVARNMTEEDVSDSFLSSVMSTERQTAALHLVEEEAAATWAAALEELTPSELRFALNACQDSSPHNSNLAIWKSHPSECKLCGERQTLLHVLCSCPVALQLRRFNYRHDLVLKVIYNLIKNHLPLGHSIIADLPDQPTFTFPPHIANTDLRPDIVVWNDTARSVSLLELTVCHESNFIDAHQQKQIRYLDLEEDIRELPISCQDLPNPSWL